jgi:transcription factor C subunit 7
MVISNIYIARHGYRANWLPPPHPVAPTGIDSDPPLATHGEEQAIELAHYFLSITPQPEIIFTSPFYRCLQTSAPIAKVLDIDIELENGVGEWYKPDRPTIPQPANYEILSPFFPSLKNNWDSVLYPSSKGETEEDIFERAKAFLEKFIPAFEKRHPKVETILIITHAATKIALGMALLGFNNVRETIDDEDTRLRAGACSLDLFRRVSIDDTVPSWKILMNGNVEFLTEGEEMHWDFLNGFEAGSDADIRARAARAAKEANIDTALQDVQPETEEEKEEYEDVYVTLDIPHSNFNTTQIPPTAKLQVSGLHTDRPLFKIDDDVYQGDWQKLVGTEVAITDDLTSKYKVTDRIKLEDVVLQ